MRTIALSLAVGWLIAGTAIAGDECKTPAACKEVQTCGSPDHCGRCGRSCGCDKYCKVVCEMKEVKKTLWVVKCEDYCLPLPGCKHGCRDNCGQCEACKAAGECTAESPNCDGCRDGKCDPCAVEKNKCLVPPKCGKVREKKTLEKKEIVCKVPSYKCVVVYACSNCADQDCNAKPTAPEPVKQAAPAPAPAAPPAAPVPEAGKTTQIEPTMPPLAEASISF